MSIFGGLFKAVRGAGETKQELTLDALIARLDHIGTTAAGEPVTPQNAMRSPTVYAVVNSTANAMANLPFTIIEKSEENDLPVRTPLPDHNVTRLLNSKPNNWQTSFEYWRQVIVNLMLWGNFYALKSQAANGKIMHVQPLASDAVTVRQTDTLALVYNVTARNGTQEYPQNRIHHIRGLSTDGLTGVAPPLLVKESIALEIAAEKFGASLFSSGALPNVVIERPGHFRTEEDRAKFSHSFREAYSGKRGTVVIEEGWKVNQLQMSNEESQFLETRKLQRQIIAGVYGIPPHRVGDLERATFSNIEHQSLEFVIYALTPLLVNIEQAIVRDFLPPRDRETLTAKFNVKALLRGDFKSRQEGLQIQRQMGIINANEWRATEDMPPIDGPAGEEYITPMNLSGSDPEPAPAPAPAALPEPEPEQIGGDPPLRAV